MCSCMRSLKHSFNTRGHTCGQARSQKQRLRVRVGEFSDTFIPLTFHVSSVGQLWVGRPDTTTPLQVCDKVLVSGRRGGRLCCTRRTGLTYRPLKSENEKFKHQKVDRIVNVHLKHVVLRNALHHFHFSPREQKHDASGTYSIKCSVAFFFYQYQLLLLSMICFIKYFTVISNLIKCIIKTGTAL